MNFHDDIPSIPIDRIIDNFKEHYLLVFGLTSFQDANEVCL